MMATDATRRTFLKVSAGLAAGAGFSVYPAAPCRARAPARELRSHGNWPELLGSWEQEGVHYVGRWSSDRGAQGMALPSRAHGVLADPGNPGHAIVVARRPGDYLVRFDPARGREVLVRKADEGRVFNGHAAFSGDGATLYTTENDTRDGSGFIGVRDAATLAKRSEFPTRGMDPHAFLVERDGTLLVANGGILTLAETGRVKLDAARMDPSLVRVDARDGTLLGQWRLPDSRLSIRHLARASNGDIAIALQSEHARPAEREQAPPLAIFDGASLRVADMPHHLGLGGYGGDVACVSGDHGTYLAVSCVRANLVGLWNDEGRWQGAIPFAAACALAPDGKTLVVGSEAGMLARIASLGSERFTDRVMSVNWDNHIVGYPRAHISS